MNRKELGRFGEAEAATFLLRKGYTLIERNLNLRVGEIDLLMEESGDIVVVEVKTQQRATIIDPIEKINPTKMRKLWMLAEIIAAKYPRHNVRLEAVTLYWKHGSTTPTITHHSLTA